MGIADDYTETVNRFGAIAQRYCAIVDTATRLEKTDLLLQIYQILPDLISEATRLPDTDPWHRNEPDDPNAPDALGQDLAGRGRGGLRMTSEAWHSLYELLKEKLGDSNLYWQVFDPLEETKAIRGSLADDIADIYRDLKGGLSLDEVNATAPAVLIWHWRMGFFSHWGQHAIDALRIIHRLLGEKFEDGEIG